VGLARTISYFDRLLARSNERGAAE